AIRDICALYFFFTRDPAPPDVYALSLHDALPISGPSATATRVIPCSLRRGPGSRPSPTSCAEIRLRSAGSRSRTSSRARGAETRSEEHTSELQSRGHLVCRLLLEKKNPSESTSRR